MSDLLPTHHVPQWHRWPEPDKDRYMRLKAQYRNLERLAPDDWEWFRVRRTALKFYYTVRRRVLMRSSSFLSTRDKAFGGYNTGAR